MSLNLPPSYVACHLCRPDATQQRAWGLWISFVDKNNTQSLVVGGLDHPTFDGLLKWCWVTSTPPETPILTNQAYGSNLWKSYFAMLPSLPYQPRTLVAGDTILTINGIPIVAFGSIANVTSYLQRCNQIFIVAERKNRAAPLSLHRDWTPVEKAHQIMALAQQFPRQSPAMPQNLRRVVTPLKSELASLPKAFPQSTPTLSSFKVTPQKHPPPKAACTKPTVKRTLELPIAKWRNRLFRDDNNSMLYADNEEVYDPDEGKHHPNYLLRVDSSHFSLWLSIRKRKWRSKWNIKARVSTYKAMDMLANLSMSIHVDGLTQQGWTNPMFGKPQGNNTSSIPYCDNYTFDPYDGSRSRQFMSPIQSSHFQTWLTQRKQNWKWKVHRLTDEEDVVDPEHSNSERSECTVRIDFWAGRYASFDEWLVASTAKWKKSYSWNSRKRKRIQLTSEEIVHFPCSHDPNIAQGELLRWLRVRKNQWRILRRKRQRRLEEAAATRRDATDFSNSDTNNKIATPAPCAMLPVSEAHPAATVSGDFLHIDALLDEEERKKKTLEEQKESLQDISFLFMPSLGLSDDVAAHCLEYLDGSEHGKLLCISKAFSKGLESRSYMWQLLCNRCPHWHLPRRPRKAWHVLYLSKLREEVYTSRKQWDDLLTKVSEVLLKGDQLKVVQRLIAAAEKKFSFTVNYISGVVCECNSILNLSVIHKRHKVVHWLVDAKNADVETSDRGHFTPLINAAWGGDKHLVRFLLQHGADRSKVGTGHYTEALAPSDFQGLTAEGWARKKGHHDIAELIRVGL